MEVSVNSGYAELTVPIVNYGYEVSTVYASNTEGIATLDVYLDNVQISHVEEYRGASGGCLYTSGPGPRAGIVLSTDLAFWAGVNSIPHGGFNSLSLADPSPVACSQTAWFPNVDPVTVSIVDGIAYGKLQLGTEGPFVTSVTAMIGEINTGLQYIANGVQPPASGGIVTLEASVRGGLITKQTSFTVTRTGCNEQTINCTAQDFQPQQFNNAWVTVLKEGDPFSWTDQSGNHTVVADGCSQVRDDRTCGGTFLMPRVPMNQSPSYHPLSSDLTRSVCLDNSDPINPTWVLKYGNIRLPIFSSACTCRYTDLGGGPAEWSQRILDKDTYDKALEDMKWWVGGGSEFRMMFNLPPYEPPNGFTFSSMMLPHETCHKDERVDVLKDKFDDAFSTIFELDNRPKKSDYPCAEDVINSISFDGPLTKAYNKALGAKTNPDWVIDNCARPGREIILTQFEEWGRTKGWF
ncbi:MAG: hypothetical protein HY707_13230 [Ignavibacteriae bacterium]|nr:hypothetical protein [Ignavibacteriota bacterium]